jgi:chromosome segregation ATPase
VSGVQKSNPFADQRTSNRLQSEQRTSAEWKARLQEQENRIADLQARIDHVNASVHSAVGTAEYDTPANRYQAVQSERLAMMQEMLDQQKRRLASMQDAARRAGMDQ